MATNPVKTFYDMDDVEVDIVAHQLASARKLAVNLANTSTDTSFDGSQDQTGIKVSGTLGVENGGTGKSSVTANSYLKGNGTGALVERTYAQVRSDLGVSDGANKVEASSSNGKIKIDGTETTVYTHPAGSAASKTGVPTTDATPAFGGTFKVNQISTDSTSHVSAVTERTITIPNTTGTASTAGLTKLYTGTGTNTDGTMTQNAIKNELDGKSDSSHTHTTSLAADSGTATVTLAHDTTYKLTAGGTSVIFKTPADNNTDTKQNVTLATTSKAFITGVTTTPTSSAQALTGVADTGVYLTTNAGELNATKYKINEACTMQYNSTTESLDFVFV